MQRGQLVAVQRQREGAFAEQHRGGLVAGVALLRDGGRLGAIVGSEPVMRFTVTRRTGDRFETTSPWDTIAPRLVNFPEPSGFTF